MISRRALLGTAALTAVAPRALGSDKAALQHALADSDLVYLTPLKANGAPSTCHGEVWFAYDGAEVIVVTASDTWRAKAVKKGVNRARLWVGDFGVWTESKGRFKTAPQTDAIATIDANPNSHTAALDLFGDKYTMEWIVWGPRFKAGLADGSRVMIRYRLV